MRNYMNTFTNAVFLAGGDERAGFGLVRAISGT
jgi:CRISPR/Cas system CMR subunit Cmr4 (Cas7 group RAMP superfamily)